MKILLGNELDNDNKVIPSKPVELPLVGLDRHLHLCGFTGTGKTTALITMLLALFCTPFRKQCVIIIDRLGGFSLDLLQWFASSFCPPWVRERLIYIEGAREEVSCPLNPLLHATPGEGYYRTAREAEIVLRGWDSQDLTQMPRLMRWLYNCMYAMCQLGLAVADSVHLLLPHDPLHQKILRSLPGALEYEWKQIIDARGGQAEVQLESCRNRMKPYYDCPPLHYMFSSTQNRFDVAGWMREKKIVILNLAPMGKLTEQAADAMGGFTVNEVFSIARSLPPEARHETVVVLDEFQRFVRGSDLEFALAESRQLKTRLFLSHQSFSQLKTESVDLTSLILQAQNRLMLKVGGLDAEILAAELAGFTFDAKRVKDELWNRCQRVSGHRVVELHSSSTAEQFAHNWNENFGTVRGNQENVTKREGDPIWTRTGGANRSEKEGRGKGGSAGQSSTRGTHESLVPVYEEFLQLASRTYYTFDENLREWGRRLRRLHRGQGILQKVDDDRLYPIAIRRTAPGHLALDWDVVLNRLPQVAEAYYQLLERNFAQPCFVSPAQIERETRERLERVLCPRIDLRSAPHEAHQGADAQSSDDNPLA